MTLEEAIKYMEGVAKESDDSAKEFYRVSKLETHPDRKIAEDAYVKCKKCADEHRQLAEWLKILKSAKFEYDEAWRAITHPTPDVTYADKQRAHVILDKFRNSLGAIYALQARDAPDINVSDMISRQAAIDCSDCIWYKYPPQSGGQFIHAAVTVSATIEETRRCELGGCDGSRKERANGRFNQQTGSD